MQQSNKNRSHDPLVELYSVSQALLLLSDKLHEECGGISCILRLLGAEVQTAAEQLDNTQA